MAPDPDIPAQSQIRITPTVVPTPSVAETSVSSNSSQYTVKKETNINDAIGSETKNYGLSHDPNSRLEISDVRNEQNEDLAQQHQQVPVINESSYFDTLFGKGFSKYNNTEICRRIFQTFKLCPLKAVYVLNTRTWTPEHEFVALQNIEKDIYLGIFNDHPMIIEFMQTIGRITESFNIIFLEGSKIVGTFSTLN